MKPGNLLLDERGRVKVADFGIASAAGLDSFTQTGTILGTAGYLSPEQARGEQSGPASDRYGLAVVAWELLTGRRPFEAQTPGGRSGGARAGAGAVRSPPRTAICRARSTRSSHARSPRIPARAIPTGAEFVGELHRALDDDAGVDLGRACRPRCRCSRAAAAPAGGADRRCDRRSRSPASRPP